METKKRLSMLDELLQVSKDGEATFQRALHITEDADLEAAFRTALRACMIASQQLVAKIEELGGKAAERGTLTGTFHRAWIDTRTAVSRHADEALLDEIVRSERAAVGRYDAARLRTRGTDLHDLVESQAAGALANLERFEALAEARSVPSGKGR